MCLLSAASMLCVIRYDGNPLKVRRGQYLSFEKDEKLEILDQSESEWWEVSLSVCLSCVSVSVSVSLLISGTLFIIQAISLTTGNKGKVPSAYLKVCSTTDHEQYVMCITVR